MDPSPAKAVVLAFADPGIVAGIYKTRGRREGDLWLYLSQDMVRFQEILERSGGGIPFAETGPELQDIARTYRDRYVEYTASLHPRDGDLFRWLSSFSEKSPFISMVFPSFCRIHLILRRITGGHRCVIAVCESRALMDAAKETLDGMPGISVEVSDTPLGRPGEQLRLRAWGLAKKAFFVLRFTLRILFARLYSLARDHRKALGDATGRPVILSEVDWRAFAGDREFQDTYFGELGARIRERGWAPCRTAQILPTILYPRALLHLVRLKEDVFVLEEFMQLRDVAGAVAGISRRFQEPPRIPPLEGVQMASLVREEYRRDRRASSRSEESFLVYPAAVRLGSRLRPWALFYAFENHMWEKMLCAGIRKTHPGTRLIGYAHSVVAPMYLFYNLAEGERTSIPLPDVIMVNGPRARDILIGNGFSGFPIEVTGALRYPGLPSRLPRTDGRSRPWRILITPTAGVHETLELVRKAAAAFPDPAEFRVILKLHPTLPFRKVSPHLKPYCPPVTLSGDPVSRLLGETDLLLVMESAAAIEALAAGVPVIHVRSDFRVDINLFEGLDWVPSLSRPDEIRAMARRILEEGILPKALPADPVGIFFAPVSGESLDRLLRPGAP